MTDEQKTITLATESLSIDTAPDPDKKNENKTEEKKDTSGDSIKSITETTNDSENSKSNDTEPCVETAPTPAETVKKEHQQQSIKKAGKARSRGKRNQGKKGAWKKLDVDISFNKDHNAISTPAASTPATRKKKPHGVDKKPSPPASPSATTSQSASDTPQSQQPKQYRTKKQINNTSESLNWRDRKKDNNLKHVSQPWFPNAHNDQIAKAKPDAMKQVEYFFTSDELCRNTFLRWNMDSEGYIPAAIVFNFPSVIRYGLPYYELLDALTSSTTVEVDTSNETIRIKGDFKKWLYPNQEGGYGCPRWIKQPLVQDQSTRTKDDGTISTPELVNCTDSDSEHTELECP